jgi:hypothetical protein
MQILTISNKDSRPEVATTALLAATGLTKISITPRALPSFDLVEIDCAIYIDQRPDFRVIERLQQSCCPSILLADQDFPDSQCLFIPFGILDRSDSVSIGINIIRDHLDSISAEAEAISLNSAEFTNEYHSFNTHQNNPAVASTAANSNAQLQQSRNSEISTIDDLWYARV